MAGCPGSLIAMNRNLLLALGIALAVAVAPASAHACATFTPDDRAVDVVHEEALITWDGATEHFVRRATFASRAPNFGFVVPTPTKPTLTGVPNSIFDDLDRAIAPGYARKTEITFGSLFSLVRSRSVSASAAAPEVSVEEHRVAGLDAAILRADDLEAIKKWLSEHGYPLSPDGTEWLEPYVAKHWYVTAFKVATSTPGNVGLEAVDLAFGATEPFYPYREPKSALDSPGRSLRVYLVADRRYDGRLEGSPGSQWAAVEWAGPLPAAAAPVLAATSSTVPGDRWLTAFVDRTTLRPRSDVVFAPAATNVPVTPPPIPVFEPLVVPVEPLVLVAIVVLTVVFVVRRKRRAG